MAASHHRTGQPVDLIVEHHLVLVSVHHGQDPLVGRDAVQRVGRVRRGVRPGLPRASHVHRHQPRADGSDEDGGVKPGQKRAFIRKVRLGLDAHRHRPRGLTGCPATGRWATAEAEPPSQKSGTRAQTPADDPARTSPAEGADCVTVVAVAQVRVLPGVSHQVQHGIGGGAHEQRVGQVSVEVVVGAQVNAV